MQWGFDQCLLGALRAVGTTHLESVQESGEGLGE